MMHTTQTLYNELTATLADVDMQIKHIKNDIKMQYPDVDPDKLNVWFWTRNADGSYVLERLLAARAQLVSAMAGLRAADLSAKTPVTRRR